MLREYRAHAGWCFGAVRRWLRAGHRAFFAVVSLLPLVGELSSLQHSGRGWRGEVARSRKLRAHLCGCVRVVGSKGWLLRMCLCGVCSCVVGQRSGVVFGEKNKLASNQPS